MIYLACVVRGQLDPVFSFKDEHKSEQDFKVTILKCSFSGLYYAQYYSIVMRTKTLHTIHVSALENYTKSDNMKKLLTEL